MFSLVSKYSTLRLKLTLVVKNGLEPMSLDIEAASLNAILDQEFYKKQLKGTDFQREE